MRYAILRTLCVAALALAFAAAVPPARAQAVTVIEYYNVALDHYFITSLKPDIDALDSGYFFGWSRTGLTFQAFADQASGGPNAKIMANRAALCSKFVLPRKLWESGGSVARRAGADDCVDER